MFRAALRTATIQVKLRVDRPRYLDWQGMGLLSSGLRARFPADDTNNIGDVIVAYTRRVPRDVKVLGSRVKISAHIKEPTGGQNYSLSYLRRRP